MYRAIEVTIWGDPWFEALKPAAKLVFLYLLTNHRQTPCGAFQVTIAAMCFETGLDEPRLAAAMAELSGIGKVEWWRDTGWIFVRRFYRRQQAHAGPTFERAARKSLSALPAEVRDRVCIAYPDFLRAPEALSVPYAYPIDTLSIPPARVNSTEQDSTEQEREQTPATAGAAGAPGGARARAGRARGEPEGFISLYEAHPRKGDRARACKVYLAAEKRGVPSAELIAGHGRWVAYWDEAATPEDKIPYLATWLNNERWGLTPPPVHAPRPPAPNGDGRRHDPTVERPLDAARYTGDGKYARFFARRDDDT